MATKTQAAIAVKHNCQENNQ